MRAVLPPEGWTHCGPLQYRWRDDNVVARGVPIRLTLITASQTTQRGIVDRRPIRPDRLTPSNRTGSPSAIGLPDVPVSPATAGRPAAPAGCSPSGVPAAGAVARARVAGPGHRRRAAHCPVRCCPPAIRRLAEFGGGWRTGPAERRPWGNLVAEGGVRWACRIPCLIPQDVPTGHVALGRPSVRCGSTGATALTTGAGGDSREESASFSASSSPRRFWRRWRWRCSPACWQQVPGVGSTVLPQRSSCWRGSSSSWPSACTNSLPGEPGSGNGDVLPLRRSAPSSSFSSGRCISCSTCSRHDREMPGRQSRPSGLRR